MKDWLIPITIGATELTKVKCPDGGIGRRAGLKHLCLHWHAGSTPALGTVELCSSKMAVDLVYCHFLFVNVRICRGKIVKMVRLLFRQFRLTFCILPQKIYEGQ